jgi:hypothetical protein
LQAIADENVSLDIMSDLHDTGSPLLTPLLAPPSSISTPPQLMPLSLPHNDGVKAVDDADERIDEAVKFMHRRDESFNPPEYQALKRDAFPPRPDVESLLQESHVFRIPYREMWPRNCPDDVTRRAEERGIALHATLYMDIRIPKVLLQASERTKLELWVDIHGGGGVSMYFWRYGKHANDGSSPALPLSFPGILKPC